MSLVLIESVEKHFGDNHVLRGVSTEVAKGDIVALVGRSGSGKSTLLRCVNGLETISAGRIVVDGVDVQWPCCAAAWAWCSRASTCSRICRPPPT
jgi:polar amino acid transport system ATP-binding protein